MCRNIINCDKSYEIKPFECPMILDFEYIWLFGIVIIHTVVQHAHC